MTVETKDINSIGELLENLLTLTKKSKKLPIWYRGQANFKWQLVPKIKRTESSPTESHLMNKFKQDASFILEKKPTSDFEWLFLMQHYGVATRLLDWSESPLVALYFAINDNNVKTQQDGAIWMLFPTELNSYARYSPVFPNEIPSFTDEELRNYEPTILAAERNTSLIPMAAIAPRNSPRMQAQKGVFTIHHRNNFCIENLENTKNEHVRKFRIPAISKDSIREELDLLQFNKFQLFPELASLGEFI